MSNSPFQLDEELLSAYLDGQLTATELREVESWLARDEAARTLVEELRGVSQQVRDLPRESVPAEWTQRLAARLDESSHDKVSPSGSADSGDAMPAFSIGRSSRGWWWSAAAIAAAVAIMAFQANNLEEATQIAKAPAAASDRSVANQPVPEMAAADSEPLLREEAMAPAPRSLPATTAVPALEPAAETLSDGPAEQPAPHSRAMSGLAFERMDDRELDSNSPYIIVWAEVPPETLRTQRINKVLSDNGIALEAETAPWVAAAEPVRRQIEMRNAGNVANSRFAFDGVAESRAAGNDGTRDAGLDERNQPALTRGGELPEPEGETILVNATASQIANCLSEMESDHTNYASIIVEPVVATPPVVASATAPRAIAGATQAEELDADTTTAKPDAGLRDDYGMGGFAPGQNKFNAADAKGHVVATDNLWGNAWRVSQDDNWYFYNRAPDEGANAYRLRVPEKLAAGINSKVLKQQPQPPEGVVQQQLSRLNMQLAESNRLLTKRERVSPLEEKQPVQVLFVLRNEALADATADVPGASDAESPPVPAEVGH